MKAKKRSSQNGFKVQIFKQKNTRAYNQYVRFYPSFFAVNFLTVRIIRNNNTDHTSQSHAYKLFLAHKLVGML